MIVQYKLIIFQYIKYKNPPMNQIFFFNPNFPLQHPPPPLPPPKKKTIGLASFILPPQTPVVDTKALTSISQVID